MLFKILHGDKSRISTEITPYHEGYAYVTYDGDFYIDMNNERIKLNAKDAETLMGASLSTILNSSDVEIPTSKTVLDAIEAASIVYVGPTEPTDPNIKVWINTAEEGTGVIPILPRVATITLPQANWVGSASPYYQTVSINTVTSSTKIDLQPTVAQITSLQDADIALMTENTDGVVKVYSFGGKPSADMTMQALLTEVSYV